jgi:hypothetical protein
VNRRELVWATLLYVALTVGLAWPLSVQAADHLLWMGPDSELFAWTLEWNAHALLNNPLAFFDANIFYPQRLTLAYSENLIGASLFSTPVLWLTHNPVLAINVVALSSCVLCGLGTYVLGRRLGLSAAAAALSGLVFAFSPARFGRLGQLHLTSIQWIPFALASLHAYLDGGRRRDLWIATALFSLQALTSGHGAVFLAMAMAALVAWRVALGERVDPLRRARDFGLVGLLLVAPAVLLVLPYRAVQQEIGLRRALDAAWWTDWRRAAVSYVASPAFVPRLVASRFVSLEVLDNALGYLFPGFLPLVLAALAWRRGTPNANRPARWRRAACWAAMAVLGAAGLALLGVAVYVAGDDRINTTIGEVRIRVAGPVRPALAGAALLALAGVIWRKVLSLRLGPFLRERVAAWRAWAADHRTDAPLFYAVLAAGTLWLSAGAPLGPWPWIYWLPGFNFIRVPARFTLISLLGLAVLAGFGADRATARWQPRRRLLAALALGAWMVAEFAMVPLQTIPYRVEIPAIDRWLDTQPKPFVVAEVPFWGERDQTTYMLHATAHWQRTVAGYSGFRPELNDVANERIRRFPSEQSLATLKSLGVTYVVVHADRYRPGQWPAVEAAIAAAGPTLALVHVEGAGRVYSLR